LPVGPDAAAQAAALKPKGSNCASQHTRISTWASRKAKRSITKRLRVEARCTSDCASRAATSHSASGSVMAPWPVLAATRMIAATIGSFS